MWKALRKLLTELSVLYTGLITVLLVVLGAYFVLQPAFVEQVAGIAFIALGIFFLHYEVATTERVGD